MNYIPNEILHEPSTLIVQNEIDGESILESAGNVDLGEAVATMENPVTESVVLEEAVIKEPMEEFVSESATVHANSQQKDIDSASNESPFKIVWTSSHHIFLTLSSFLRLNSVLLDSQFPSPSSFPLVVRLPCNSLPKIFVMRIMKNFN
jgi:hypothetical protein